MLKTIKYSVLALFLTACMSFFASAYANDPKEFINSLMQDTLKVLDKKSQITQTQYVSNLEDIMVKNFAVNYMAKEVIGPSIANFDEAKKQDYLTTFKEYTFLTYAYLLARFSFDNSEFSVISAAEQGNGEFLVNTQFKMKQGEPQKISWRVKKVPNSDKFLVIDIMAVGVSVVQTKRSEFTSLLQAHNNDVNFVLSSLKQIIVKLKAQKLEGFKS